MMPISTLNGCCCANRVQPVGFGWGGVGDVFGGILKTGLETGIKVGVQYGISELVGRPNQPASQIPQQSAPAASTPVVTLVQPAASSSVNTNTLMIVGAIAVLAVVISRR